MNCKLKLADLIRSLAPLATLVFLVNHSVSAQGPSGPGVHFEAQPYGQNAEMGYRPHGPETYSTTPVFPAPPDHGYRPTRWRPWNRATIYPVYPGMPEPPSSGPRQTPRSELQPEPNGDGETNGDGTSTPDSGIPDPNGDDAPELPPDLNPGLPLPGSDPDEFSPSSPYEDESPTAPQDLAPPASDDEDAAEPDALPDLPDELPLPTGQPGDSETSLNDGWKTSGRGDAWRKTGTRQQRVATVSKGKSPTTRKPQPTKSAAVPRVAESRGADFATARPRYEPRPSRTVNPLRPGQPGAHVSHVVPAAKWEYDRP